MSETLAQQFSSYGYRFVPLATESLSLLCRIEILFLRPETPGALIKSGDIDNRLKTLFDALRMPSAQAEMGQYAAPATDEDPFFCLLQDDKLVSHVSVETDILLEPTGDAYDINDSRLVISVTLTPYDVLVANIQFV